MNKILITGSTGFIGKTLVDYLKSNGFEILEFPREKGDITQKEIWKSIAKVNYVVHLAARNFVPDSWKESSDFLESNVIGTSRMLEYAKEHDSKVIFVSAYLYGKPEILPIKEAHPLLPNNPYALSKVLSEEVCRFHSQYFDQDITILRLFNVYGPGQRSSFLIPTIVNQCLKNDKIEVLDLEPKRDYVYIEDVLNAILLSIKNVNKFQLYNIGSGTSFSVSEIIDRIQKICNTKLPVISSQVVRKNEIMDVIADISLAKKELNWVPQFDLAKGLEKTIATLRKFD
ncbi:NAD-dependent epimerase/dehydratase family protein [Leptospira bouyouniensis]|uniref:NAD-dependent epimerase/dehydratase family protein n=1 Tax=Leptospira bouyouniensis TaxID=2484911 RepID=A0ABY2L755_9LEPT|nr:NAD-dependent epimerase/dehydratase family protein [Leptospira bouyouniensis]TGK48568.1 NAD-dependent epimerase/dehydratase family protein [Leptospira bouyouniensis]